MVWNLPSANLTPVLPQRQRSSSLCPTAVNQYVSQAPPVRKVLLIAKTGHQATVRRPGIVLLFEFSGKQNAKGENKDTDRTQQLELSFKAFPKFLDKYCISQSSHESSSPIEGDLQVTNHFLKGKQFHRRTKLNARARRERNITITTLLNSVVCLN